MGKLFIRNWKLEILQRFEVGKKAKNHQKSTDSTQKNNEKHPKMFKIQQKKCKNNRMLLETPGTWFLVYYNLRRIQMMEKSQK